MKHTTQRWTDVDADTAAEVRRVADQVVAELQAELGYDFADERDAFSDTVGDLLHDKGYTLDDAELDKFVSRYFR